MITDDEIAAQARTLVSDLTPSVYDRDDPDLADILDAIKDGVILREAGGDDGDDDSSVLYTRVVGYTAPDTGLSRWAVVHQDDNVTETIDWDRQEYAEVYYERLVRDLVTVSEYSYEICDVDL